MRVDVLYVSRYVSGFSLIFFLIPIPRFRTVASFRASNLSLSLHFQLITLLFCPVDFIANAVSECQQSSPKAFSCYASAPNDVWSLGVILVNLTCGRNPWKRASMDDSTFRAYVRDPNFLRKILPLSPELDSILRRIFECNPARRISTSELRELIIACPSFTTWSGRATQETAQAVSCGQPVYHGQEVPRAQYPASQDVTSSTVAVENSVPYFHPVMPAQAVTPISPMDGSLVRQSSARSASSSGSGESDADSIFSDTSALSSNCSDSSYTLVDSPPKTAAPADFVDSTQLPMQAHLQQPQFHPQYAAQAQPHPQGQQYQMPLQTMSPYVPAPQSLVNSWLHPLFSQPVRNLSAHASAFVSPLQVF